MREDSITISSWSLIPGETLTSWINPGLFVANKLSMLLPLEGQLCNPKGAKSVK